MLGFTDAVRIIDAWYRFGERRIVVRDDVFYAYSAGLNSVGYCGTVGVLTSISYRRCLAYKTARVYMLSQEGMPSGNGGCVA